MNNMNTSSLPEGYGQLGIGLQLNDWRTEINLHTTGEYQQQLYELRENSDSLGCYYCGFQDGPYLEIHHLDGNHTNFERANLRACCTLCHRLNHLGWVGFKNHGKLIQLPSYVYSEDGERIALSLEVFNIIQRFYLMSSYLATHQQKKLEALPLKTSINAILNAFKRRNYELDYHAVKKESAEKLEERARLQEMNKEQKDAFFTQKLAASKQDNASQEVNEVSFLAGGLHIIDLVDALCEEHHEYERTPNNQRGKQSPALSFLNQQKQGEYGRLTVWYNQEVFAPFAYDAFTLDERMDYYNETQIFSPQSIAKILNANRSHANLGREQNNKRAQPLTPQSAGDEVLNIDAKGHIVNRHE